MRKIDAPILILVFVLGTTTLRAQATRTWVSGVGDDANPCSRTAPCKTFAGAMPKTAAGGEIDVLDPGGFGAVTITKSITIDGGEGQVGSILVSGTNGIVVNAPFSATVTLKNLSINGIGSGINGIRVTSVGAINIDHCHIQNFTQNGIDIELSVGGAGVDIADTVSSEALASGLYATTSVGTVYVNVTRSRFDDDVNGVFAGSNTSVSVKDSIAGYASLAFVAQASSGNARMMISNSVAQNSSTGIQAGGSSGTSTVLITGVSIFGNSSGLVIASNSSIISFGNNYNADSGSPSSTISPQ